MKNNNRINGSRDFSILSHKKHGDVGHKIAEDLVFNSVLTELSTQLSRTQMTRLHKKDYFKGKIV